jgi:uncharacterized protein
VLDTTGRITLKTREKLDALGKLAHRSAGAEIVVVVVDTVRPRDSREAAQALFNRWRLGSAARDNGILLLAALDDRKAEIVLGDGVDNPSRVRESERIMQEVVVPRFRAGDPNGAMLEGARACAQRILGVSLGWRTDASRAARSVGNLAGRASSAVWVALGFLAMVGGLVLRAYLRYRGRRCPRCGTPMRHLDENADDKYLTPVERTEERVGSVDYDVWLCPRCQHTLKNAFGAWLGRRSTCPGCSGKTLSSQTETLERATQHREGVARVTETCAHCKHRRTYTRVIPRDPPRTSRRSGRSSSSGGWGGSGGGGSTSGRGSSGSW